MNDIEQQLGEFLANLGIAKDDLGITEKYILIGVLVFIAFLVDYLCRLFLVPVVKKLTMKTQVKWDDYIFNDKMLNNACHLIPAIILSITLPMVLDVDSDAYAVFMKLIEIYLVIVSVKLICTFLTSLYTITSEYEEMKTHPLKGVYQMLKIIVVSIGIIIIIANLIEKSPMSILTGLGASAAILMLVFKDSIMGLVSGVQLSANDMLAPGDWISMPKYSADGIVTEVTLTTVKVRNWDNTIITVPPYALVSDSFQNWRGMQEGDGRRVKRSVSIDMKTIRFCTDEETEYFIKKGWINKDESAKDKFINLSVFRSFMENYLRNNPDVNKNMTLMVRQLQSSSEGLPIEIYCFTTDKEWIKYEKVQSDIIDYFIAMLPQFGLKVFQRSTGDTSQSQSIAG
jgi:miniconductance mechanosensitive channel